MSTPVLAQAQEAFKTYRARCFWFMKPDLIVTPQNVASIIHGLKTSGDRNAYVTARRIASLWAEESAEQRLSRKS